MIPRTLVPFGVRPGTDGASKAPARRLSSPLDVRTVIPVGLPVAPIDPKSSIPSHVPLDVLVTRTLVPRGLPAKPLVEVPKIPEYVPLSILDSRTVVPAYVEPPPEELAELEQPQEVTSELLEVIEPDLITTGEVNLLLRPVEERGARWEGLSRLLSVLVHCGLIVFAFFSPKLFPPHVPTQAELDLARQQLSFVYLPPSVNEVPRTAPRPERPSEHMRIDPRILREVAPPAPETALRPEGQPNRPPAPAELPSAPVPQPSVAQPQPSPRPSSPSQPAMRQDDLRPKQGALNLALPNVSPGRALEQSVQDALHRGGGPSVSSAEPIPGGGPGGGGEGGQGYLGNGVQILTPTEGVDFSNYLARLLATVKRNWYAIIPESARLGERGKVVIQFHIQRDGSVPLAEPNLVRTSGKEPLDRAAMSAIHASNPFEPLPPAFSGPSIELRFIFLYNLPLDYQ